MRFRYEPSGLDTRQTSGTPPQSGCHKVRCCPRHGREVSRPFGHRYRFRAGAHLRGSETVGIRPSALDQSRVRGSSTPFGFGWKLPLPSITRKIDKGLPPRQYEDARGASTLIPAGAEDLVLPMWRGDSFVTKGRAWSVCDLTRRPHPSASPASPAWVRSTTSPSLVGASITRPNQGFPGQT